MHNLELTDEQTMIAESVRKLVLDVVRPQALERDEHREFVRASFDGLAELGVFGAAVGESSGGAGLGWLSLVVAVEECARACGSTARLLMTQAGIVAKALEGIAAGSDLLGRVLGGAVVGAYVFGKDAGVRVDGGGLTGRARLVTGGGEAAVILVAVDEAGEPRLYAVDRDRARIEPLHALGFRATAPASVHFERTPATELARGAEAAEALRRAELAACIGAGALAIGSASEAIELARRHAGERVAFGKPLLAQQAVVRKLVEARLRTEAARHLVFHAARLADLGAYALESARFAKLSAVDAAVHAADEAIQIHGGYGYTVEYHVERHYRDAKTLEVIDRSCDALRDSLSS